MIIKEIDKVVIAWQEWSDDDAGESAIVIKKYADSIELSQNDNSILISNHEVKSFIKLLHKIENNRYAY